MANRKAVYNKEATMRYLAKLKEIRFRVKPEDFARYEEAARSQSYTSMRQFYIDAIEDKVKQKPKQDTSES